MTIARTRPDRVFRPLAFAGLSLALAAVALAHHSQSEFDSKLGVDVEGKVTRLEWKSPHARLYVDVVSREGKTENWNFELASPTTLMRRGWKRDSLKPGDQVRVTGSRARNFPTIAYARSIRDGSGKPLFTGVTKIYEPEPAAEAPEQAVAPRAPGKVP